MDNIGANYNVRNPQFFFERLIKRVQRCAGRKKKGWYLLPQSYIEYLNFFTHYCVLSLPVLLSLFKTLIIRILAYLKLFPVKIDKMAGHLVMHPQTTPSTQAPREGLVPLRQIFLSMKTGGLKSDW